jgi:hypothetical protein
MEIYPKLIGYLVVAYVISAAAMSWFAGSQSEVLAFGAWVWVIPAVVAFVFRNEATFADRYKWSVLYLIAIIALAWAVGLTFQMTY